MIKHTFIAIMILLFAMGYASGQTIIIGQSTTRHLDTIYSGAYTPFIVTPKKDKYKCKELSIRAENMEVIKENNCLYYIRPKIIEGYAAIVFNDRKGDLVHSKNLYVSRSSLPLPELDLSHKKQAEVGYFYHKVDTLILREPVSSNKYNAKRTFEIVFFILEISREGVVYFSEENYGNYTSQEYRKVAYEELHGNDVISLRNVVVKNDLGHCYIIPFKKFRVTFN